MKIAFCTCVQIGLSCIEAIVADGGHFDLFLTLHDHKAKKKSGRIYLDEIAKQTNTPLYKLNHINDSDVAEVLKEYQIDWLFIIGWSQIASPELLKIPYKGIIGAHPTLLPTGRGRAAVPWAILKGLDKTGVTFFKMDEGVDTGPILDQFEIPLSSTETATILYQKVNDAHVGLVRQIWPKLLADSIVGRTQDESKASTWEGRTPADGQLFAHMTVAEVDCMVRATTHPYPGAFLMEGDSKCLIWAGIPGKTEGKVLNFSDGEYTATEFSYS
ncbi:formyltransferase family protein [Algoriphagus sp. A40]|uniref:formyltransferase family protein n=1 Tax=Algoriphagus sp. A40 TaxID=1945863 RepID=UPI00098433AF|nr:formyltransferase family protein [Algoriphagus sp. A40]OOG74581.1 methionyl-tRNA formyltransferase [Algoriphagus sp. A40]